MLADYSANYPAIDFAGLNAFAPLGYEVVAYYEGSNGANVQMTAGSYFREPRSF